MSKWTKGPWEVHGVCGYMVSTAHGNEGYLTRDIECEHDAILMAAAPDMYEALEGLMSTLPPPFYADEILAHDAARAALSRARGEGGE